ncbi:MAG: carbonic anhydrase [Gemmataceae bacterium]
MAHSSVLRALVVGTVAAALATPLFGQETTDPERALQRVKEGNVRYIAGKTTAKDLAKQRDKVAKEQHPFAIVLACADSRVAPELVFDQGLGDVFVVRVAGNVTDPAIIGSIEYAVAELKAPLVIVLGHESCGAVKAALSGEEFKGDLGKLIKLVHVEKNVPKDKKEALQTGIKTNALHQADVLATRSEVLKDFASSNRIKIVTGIYSLSTGEVHWVEKPKKKSRD